MKMQIRAGSLANRSGRCGVLGSAFFAIALAVSSGCSKPPQAEEPTATTTEPEPAPVAIEEPSPEPEPAREAQEPTPPPGPAPTEVVSNICDSICRKVEGSCAARVADFCRASCRDYVGAAEKCPVEVRDALSCQVQADDFLLCSNIAAESCAPLYRTMNQCRDGEVAAKPWGESTETPQASDIPAGFEQKSVPAHGFSQIVPVGSKMISAEGGHFELKGTDSAGIAYVVKSIELGRSKKVTDKSILFTAIGYVGNACQPKLRLHGRFETQDVVHVRFDTVCEDGTAYHGMLHFWDDKTMVATTILPTNSSDRNPNLEPFLFGFSKL